MTISLLTNNRIVLGVSGSIACYKSIDLASKLTQAGALVDVILTDAAQKFVSALAFQSVTGRTVYRDLWDDDGHVAHVKLGESADLLIVSPATAHTLGKLANGLADNMLTVTALTARCPVLVAPAMDGGMYEHAAVQANLAQLQSRGVTLIEPKEGRMASGLVGKGRLPETAEMLGHIRLALARDGALAGKRVLVTTGPTRESFDPVRFISNRSTGKQGTAMAQAALDMGAQVTLIRGPIAQPAPTGAAVIEIETAIELHDAVLARLDEIDVLVMVAAVGDFRPKSQATQKIKKKPGDDAPMVVELARNPDILAAVKQKREKTGLDFLTVGFAAETENVVANGRSKLERKGLDLIAINDVSGQQTGFGVETNQIMLLARDGNDINIPLSSKAAVSTIILEQVVSRLEKAEGRN